MSSPSLLLLLLASVARANDPVLLFAQSSVFQFTVGISMPIAMAKRGNLVANLGYQFNYALPWNASQLEPTIVHARSSRQADHSRSLDLFDVYLSLEDLLHRYGWGDARQCMLKTICELAETPFDDRRHDDVLERIIHLLLTPSEDGEGETTMRVYQEAEVLGRSGQGQCATAYNGCLGSPLDSITELGHGSLVTRQARGKRQTRPTFEGLS